MKSRYNQKAQSLNGGKPQDNVFSGNKTDLYHHRELGLKDKDLIGIPWRVAFALQADGWWLRQDIIWHKPNPMPESVTDRCTKAHEYVFLLSKSARYYYDNEAVKEPLAEKSLERAKYGWDCDRPSTKNASDGGEGIHVNQADFAKRFVPNSGRNRRDVWSITTQGYSEAHFATMPEKLVEPCVLAGTSEKGCCPKCGAPWERVIIKDTDYTDDVGNMGKRGSKWANEDNQSSGNRIQRNLNSMRAQGRDHDNPFPIKSTIGWQPSCACNAGNPVPCVVLDPFSGAGTVGVVAKRLGRDYIGIELNPDYIEMSERRIAKVQPTLAIW